MQVIEKFIINRNNMQYLYTEKLVGGFNNIQYHVFYNKAKYQTLSPYGFECVYGNDEQYSILNFIEFLKTDLLCNEFTDERIGNIINNCSKLEARIKLFSQKNPSLYGYNDFVLSTIDIYNELISKRPKDEEHNYTEDLLKLYSSEMVRGKNFNDTDKVA